MGVGRCRVVGWGQINVVWMFKCLIFNVKKVMFLALVQVLK